MDIEKRKALGIKLMIGRKAKKLTQTAVAEKIGIHQTHYQRIERGKMDLCVEQLIILCYYLNVNLCELTEIYGGVGARGGEAGYGVNP
jgi:transcriptional regulator with XRE-family HTH domain